MHEGKYELSFLKNCEEVFLTGTAVEITPVISIDEHKFKVGKLTKKLIEEFNNLVSS